MPASSAAASIVRPSAASRAKGFSQRTCLPAAMAASAISACVCGGVAMVTASTTVQREGLVDRGEGREGRRTAPARVVVLSGSRPTTAATSMPAAAQRAHVGHAAEPGADHRPHGSSGLPQYSPGGLGRAASRLVARQRMKRVREHLDPDGRGRAGRRAGADDADEVEFALSGELPVVERRVAPGSSSAAFGPSSSWIPRISSPGTLGQFLRRVTRADQVPRVDVEPAVALVGEPDDLGRRGEIGDPRPRQPLEVDDQPVLGRPFAQAGERLGGVLGRPTSPPKTSTALSERAPKTSAIANRSASPKRKTSSLSSEGGIDDLRRTR